MRTHFAFTGSMAGTETGSGTGTRRDAEGTGSFERMVGMAPAFASAVDA